MSWKEDIQVKAHEVAIKLVKHAGTAAAGLAAALLLKHFHVALAADHQVAIAVFVSGILGSGLNFLHQKFPNQLGWL